MLATFKTALRSFSEVTVTPSLTASGTTGIAALKMSFCAVRRFAAATTQKVKLYATIGIVHQHCNGDNCFCVIQLNAISEISRKIQY